MTKVETEVSGLKDTVKSITDKLETIQKTIWLATGALLLGSAFIKLAAGFFGGK